MRTRKNSGEPSIPRAVVYLRVSTTEQSVSGLGLEAQLVACQATVAARGWSIAKVITDAGVSGSVAPMTRPGMAEALDLLRTGAAEVLVAAKLDRLSRSTVDLLGLVDRSEKCRFEIATADASVDTSTASGRFVVTALAAVSELERRLIGERTAAALAAKKARGARLGRPITTPEVIRRRAGELRAEGLSIQAVADTLNSEGHRTSVGTEWTKAGAQRLLNGLSLDAEAEACRSAWPTDGSLGWRG